MIEKTEAALSSNIDPEQTEKLGMKLADLKKDLADLLQDPTRYGQTSILSTVLVAPRKRKILHTSDEESDSFDDDSDSEAKEADVAAAASSSARRSSTASISSGKSKNSRSVSRRPSVVSCTVSSVSSSPSASSRRSSPPPPSVLIYYVPYPAPAYPGFDPTKLVTSAGEPVPPPPSDFYRYPPQMGYMFPRNGGPVLQIPSERAASVSHIWTQLPCSSPLDSSLWPSPDHQSCHRTSSPAASSSSVTALPSPASSISSSSSASSVASLIEPVKPEGSPSRKQASNLQDPLHLLSEVSNRFPSEDTKTHAHEQLPFFHQQLPRPSQQQYYQPTPSISEYSILLPPTPSSGQWPSHFSHPQYNGFQSSDRFYPPPHHYMQSAQSIHR